MKNSHWSERQRNPCDQLTLELGGADTDYCEYLSNCLGRSAKSASVCGMCRPPFRAYVLLQCFCLCRPLSPILIQELSTFREVVLRSRSQLTLWDWSSDWSSNATVGQLQESRLTPAPFAKHGEFAMDHRRSGVCTSMSQRHRSKPSFAKNQLAFSQKAKMENGQQVRTPLLVGITAAYWHCCFRRGQPSLLSYAL